jgi:hypothetical protein
LYHWHYSPDRCRLIPQAHYRPIWVLGFLDGQSP